MIIVLLGTQNNQFTRLLKEIEKNMEDGIIKEEVIVQAGYTKYNSDKMKIFEMIDKEELKKLVDKASLVITHAGVGSISIALGKGKKVIAVPRLSKYSEHVNDHQLDIVNEFANKGYIIGIKDVSELKDAIIKSKDFVPNEYKSNSEKLIKIIEGFIENN